MDTIAGFIIGALLGMAFSIFFVLKKTEREKLQERLAIIRLKKQIEKESKE